MNKAEQDTLLYYRQRTREAICVPPEDRTKGMVESLQRSVYGCCDRHVDQTACDCMRDAEED